MGFGQKHRTLRRRTMTNDALVSVWKRLAPVVGEPDFCPVRREEDGTVYDGVWQVTVNGSHYILKRAKEFEAEIYCNFFSEGRPYVPKLLGSVAGSDGDYLLLEQIEGRNLQRCTFSGLAAAVDSLSLMQNEFWENQQLSNKGLLFEESFAQRKKRRNYLCSALLEKYYDEYLLLYERLPRTLCHDDLLPFNILLAKNRAVMIDWEIGGILPYPTSLARLIAHGRTHGDLFRMTPKQRAFAVERYYSQVAARQGIGRTQFDREIALFVFAESCEWVFVGNRFGREDCRLYPRYYRAALQAARRMEAGIFIT